MINLRQIEAFRAVMLGGTVTAAAERLRVSQPAVSRLISQLETRSKLKLFIRRNQRLHPTPEALAFYREVEKSFVGLEKLERTAANISNLVTGTLRIAALPALGLGFVPHVIAQFKLSHPEVSVVLQTRSVTTVLDWTASANFDFGLIGFKTDAPYLDCEPFAAPAGTCIVPSNHKLARKRRIEPRDLENEEFISLDPADPNRTAVDEVFRKAGVQRRMTVETPYAAAVCALVREGLGVSIISPLTARDFADQKIVAVPFVPEIPFPTSLIWLRERPLSKLAQTFIRALKAYRDACLK
jgi:DNA-binding transcriptional LysR family regulator